VTGRVGVMLGRVAVGNKACTRLIQAVSRVWWGNVGDREDRVDLIGSVNVA